MVKIYLDSCVYIYFFEGHPQYGPPSKDILKKAEKGEIQIVASPLIVQEIMSGLYRQKDVPVEETWGTLMEWWNIRWTDLSVEIADEAAQLSAFFNLRAPDAIHLATALAEDCSSFITNDKELLRVSKALSLKIELI